MSKAQPKMVSSSVRLERLELKRVKERTSRLIAALEEAMDTDPLIGFDNFTPPMDIWESDDGVRAVLELPGVRAEDVEVSVSAETVIIEGEKRHSPEGEGTGSSHYCCERTYGRFRRRIHLQWAIDVRDVKAVLSGGTLSIFLPKLVDRRGKTVRIPVETVE